MVVYTSSPPVVRGLLPPPTRGLAEWHPVGCFFGGCLIGQVGRVRQVGQVGRLVNVEDLARIRLTSHEGRSFTIRFL